MPALVRRRAGGAFGHIALPVETSCSAFMAAFIVCHARLAHFTRIGYSRTPESTASLPSASISTSEVAGAVSIVWNFSKNASASRIVLPFNSSVIIDAEAFEMAQPVPWTRT